MSDKQPDSPKQYTKVAQAVFGESWAILPSRLDAIAEVVQLRLAGEGLSEAEIEARTSKGRTKFGAVRGNVAVLPLYGVLMQHAGLMTEISGGVSADTFAEEFDAVLADPEVGAIVIDVDSPGGQVYGTGELSTHIFNARGKKPIVAVANSLAASAAYWVATAADELAVTPGGEVGSVGVVAVHIDESGADEQAGLKRTIIQQGKYKSEGNPYQPLDDTSKAHLQEDVNRYYDMFVDAVARNRGTTAMRVQKGYGEGRVVGAQEALDLGMADRVATLDEVVGRLAGKKAEGPRGPKGATKRREIEVERLRYPDEPTENADVS